jgi:hypothetical protein
MNRLHEITAAFTQSLQASRSDDDMIRISRREYYNMQDLIAVLQAAADKWVKFELAHINSCQNLRNAIELQSLYNSAWFRDAPYSDDALREIAEALMLVCEPYLPDNPVWLRASQGDYPQADLFDEQDVNQNKNGLRLPNVAPANQQPKIVTPNIQDR